MNDVTDGIRDYLTSGGLFNPELMDHQRVRSLVIECRDEIERLRKALLQIAALAEYGTTGAGKCHSDGLSAKQATSLRLAISTIAREALGE